MSTSSRDEEQNDYSLFCAAYFSRTVLAIGSREWSAVARMGRAVYVTGPGQPHSPINMIDWFWSSCWNATNSTSAKLGYRWERDNGDGSTGYDLENNSYVGDLDVVQSGSTPCFGWELAYNKPPFEATSPNFPRFYGLGKLITHKRTFYCWPTYQDINWAVPMIKKGLFLRGFSRDNYLALRRTIVNSLGFKVVRGSTCPFFLLFDGYVVPFDPSGHFAFWVLAGSLEHRGIKYVISAIRARRFEGTFDYPYHTLSEFIVGYVVGVQLATLLKMKVAEISLNDWIELYDAYSDWESENRRSSLTVRYRSEASKLGNYLYDSTVLLAVVEGLLNHGLGEAHRRRVSVLNSRV